MWERGGQRARKGSKGGKSPELDICVCQSFVSGSLCRSSLAPNVWKVDGRRRRRLHPRRLIGSEWITNGMKSAVYGAAVRIRMKRAPGGITPLSPPPRRHSAILLVGAARSILGRWIKNGGGLAFVAYIASLCRLFFPCSPSVSFDVFLDGLLSEIWRTMIELVSQ